MKSSMGLRTFLIRLAFVLLTVVFVLLCASSALIYQQTAQSYDSLKDYLIEMTWDTYKDELAGSLILNDPEIMQSLLNEISKKRQVSITVISGDKQFRSGQSFGTRGRLFKITAGDNELGTITIASEGGMTVADWLGRALVYSVFALLVLCGGFLIAYRLFSRHFLRPISAITKAIQTDSITNLELPTTTIAEVAILGQQLKQLPLEIELRAKAQSMADLASQVSHDIRSPLSALNMMVSTALGGMDEDRRLLIRQAVQRINDIANSLLKKSRTQTLKASPSPSAGPSKLRDVMLVSILENIVSEKRIQFREKLKVEIAADLTEGYGLFAMIDASEFARVISNLVNNSVEALPPHGGRVTISLRVQGDSAVIHVTDNGSGIPPALLSRLGERGFTMGKSDTESGTGLGLYHAKTTIESLGGKLTMASKLGMGTQIQITLARVNPPNWFVEELRLSPGQILCSIDDDQTIHQIWNERLSDLKGNQFQHLTFSSIEGFRSYFQRHKPGPVHAEQLYLVDFEFLGQQGNGLQLIDELNIRANSILVTSRYDEENVLKEAARLQVRIIPKGLAPFIPITIVPRPDRNVFPRSNARKELLSLQSQASALSN